MFININSGEITKPRYRFRQNLKTGGVECLSGQWPPVHLSKQKPGPSRPRPTQATNTIYDNQPTIPKPERKEEQTFKLAMFPGQAGWCPKCRGRGVIISQATRKPMGVCFWCDGKGRLDERDLQNQLRRRRLGLPTDFRTGL